MDRTEGGLKMVTKEDFAELIRLVQSIIHNLDDHLKKEHGQKYTGKGDNLRFYLHNIEKSCSELLGKYVEEA